MEFTQKDRELIIKLSKKVDRLSEQVTHKASQLKLPKPKLSFQVEFDNRIPAPSRALMLIPFRNDLQQLVEKYHILQLSGQIKPAEICSNGSGGNPRT